MKNDEAEFDWEILPWASKENYAIYADREENHPFIQFGPPAIAISNQGDCNETFYFETVEELDAFSERLAKARIWLSQQ